MSSDTIAIVTLWVGVIAAVAAIIAAIPQVPALWKLLVPAKPSVTFEDRGNNELLFNVVNGKYVSLDEFVLILKFNGASEISPLPLFTGTKGHQGFIHPPNFVAIGDDMLQAGVKDTIAARGGVQIGTIRVKWLPDTENAIDWEISRNHKVIASDSLKFN